MADVQPVQQQESSAEGGGEPQRFSSNDDSFLNRQIEEQQQRTAERFENEAAQRLASEAGGVEDMRRQCLDCRDQQELRVAQSINIIERTEGPGKFAEFLQRDQLLTANPELYRLAQRGLLDVPDSMLPRVAQQRPDGAVGYVSADGPAPLPGMATEAPAASPEAHKGAPGTQPEALAAIADQTQPSGDQIPPSGDQPVAGDAGLTAMMLRSPHRGPGRAGDGPADIPAGWGRQPDANDNNRRELTAQDTPQGVLDAMREAGAPEAQIRQMEQYLQQMEQNLRQRGLTDAQVQEQMNRSSAALRDMLRGRDGQIDGPLNRQTDRINLALSAAGSVADTRTMNQAGTNQCALTSINRAAVSGHDPASALEATASAVNRGGFYTNGQWTDLSHVAAGMRPSDQTGSSRMFDPAFHSGNHQSLFMQIRNQMVGERMAQYQGGHYLAANAGTRTGEAFYNSTADLQAGRIAFESPNSTANNVARALYETTGQRLLMHAAMARELNGNPPSQYIATFSNEQEMRAAMDANLRATGSRDNPFWNQAGFLPGQRAMAGHTHHLASLENNADGTVGLRNNWGQSHNLASMNYDQIDRATNLDRQRQEARTQGEDMPRYDRDTRAEPGDRTNLEKLEESRRRQDDERRREEEQQQRKEREEAQRRAEREQAAESQAQAAYAAALAQYNATPADQRSGPPPTLDQFRRMYSVV